MNIRWMIFLKNYVGAGIDKASSILGSVHDMHLQSWYRFIFFFVCILIGIFALSPHFSKELVPQFGFTKEFTAIADTSAITHSFSTTIHGHMVRSVQREPLYPIALLIMRRFGGDYAALIPFQMIAVALAGALWMFVIHKRTGIRTAGFFFLFFFLSPVIQFYTAVLYPYAFQFLAISLGFWLLIFGLERQRYRWFFLAGIAFAVAIYERGAYLLLPIWLALSLWVFRKYVPVRAVMLLVFVMTTFLCVSPWLFRNAKLGVSGMNAALGYALGYTYGALPSAPRSDFAKRYEAMIGDMGTDAGSLQFIWDEGTRPGMTIAAVNARVTKAMFRKIVMHPFLALRIVFLNVLGFPSRLMSIDFGRFFPFTYMKEPWAFYRRYAVTDVPTIADLFVLFGALRGMARWRKEQPIFAVVGGSIVVYTLGIFSLLTVFSPVYRGAVDLILFFAASYEIIQYRSFGYASGSAQSEKPYLG